MTDTDGTLLASHTPGTGGSYAVYPGYTSLGTIRSNRVCNDGSNSFAVYTNTASLPTPNYEVSADIVILTVAGEDNIGLAGRADHTVSVGNDTYYYVAYDNGNGNWVLAKGVAGVFTTIGTYSQALSLSTTYNASLVMRGTSIKTLIDGAERISVTDSSITSAFRAGLYTHDSGAGTGYHIDNYLAQSDASLPPALRRNVTLRM